MTVSESTRLSDPGANCDHALIAHFYRLSLRPKFSRRDLSPESTQIIAPETVAAMSRGKRTASGNPVEILFVLTGADVGRRTPGIWRIVDGVAAQLPTRQPA